MNAMIQRVKSLLLDGRPFEARIFWAIWEWETTARAADNWQVQRAALERGEVVTVGTVKFQIVYE